MNRKTYIGRLKTLAPNQIFVFGSNTEGRHGAGSAKVAFKYFGAIYGQSQGIQGQSYAIITKDLTESRHPSILTTVIEAQIKMLYDYAKRNKDKEFLIAYSADSILLNGYSLTEMATMFKCSRIPRNIIFEKGFYKITKNL
jgi:hypothetical protein